MDTQHKGASQARRQFPALLDDAEKGHATIITRHGKPVAALVPMKDYVPPVRQLSILGS